MGTRSYIEFYLNGTLTRVGGDNAFEPLSEFLRKKVFLSGTKVVCAEGDCGACSVLIAWPFRPNPSRFKSPFRVINACIAPLYGLDGASVVTVEGIKNADGDLSELQKSFVSNFASQCGYCTPGFICASTYLCEQYSHKPVTPQKIKNVLTGNLCRCTGYESIVTAVEQAIPKYEHTLQKRYLNKSILSKLKTLQKDSIEILTESGKKLFVPKTEKQASLILAKHSDVRISSSNTDLGVIHNKEKIDLYKVLSLSNIPSLYKYKESAKHLFIGSRVDLETLRRLFETKYKTLSEFLNIFASPPIRSAATLVGNFSNASPIADTSPWILLLGGYVIANSAKGSRRIDVNKFFLAYKKTALKPKEWISALVLNKPTKEVANHLKLYKISLRRDLDISCVNMALSLVVDKSVIKDFRWAVGGVAATTFRDLAFEKQFVNQKYNPRSIFSDLSNFIDKNIQPISDLRGSNTYRRLQLKSLIKKYLFETQGDLV